jgi:hypothetical protein
LRGQPLAQKPGQSIADIAKEAQPTKDGVMESRDKLNVKTLDQIGGFIGPGSTALGGRGTARSTGAPGSPNGLPESEALRQRNNLEMAKKALAEHKLDQVQGGKLGVELSLDSSNLRNQSRVTQTAVRNVAGRNCLELGGIWIDEDFDAKTPLITVKAQSDAYFRLLERHSKLKEVFQLGNALVWLTPSGKALVVDPGSGVDKLTDAEIDALFTAKK